MKAPLKCLAIAIQQLLERFNLKVNLNQADSQSSVPLKKSDYFEKSWQDVGSIFGRNDPTKVWQNIQEEEES